MNTTMKRNHSTRKTISPVSHQNRAKGKKSDQKEIKKPKTPTSPSPHEEQQSQSESKIDNSAEEKPPAPPAITPFQNSQRSRAIKFIKDEKYVFLSIDIEQWEFNIRFITEIGLTIYRPSTDLLPQIKTQHIIVSEYKKNCNGRYVPNNKNNFAGGKSYMLSKNDTRDIINGVIKRCSQESTLVIVGHGVDGDIKALKYFGVDFPKNYEKLDTMEIWRETRKDGPCRLEVLLKLFNLPFGLLHNAGNDAYATMLLLLKLADPVVRERYKLEDAPTERELKMLTKAPKKNGNNKAPPTVNEPDEFINEMFET